MTSGDYDFGKRMYDSRICRLLSRDPLSKDYPWYTPYQFAGNTPIQAIDLLGEQPAYVIRKWTHSPNYGGLYPRTSDYNAVLTHVEANTVNVAALLKNEDVHGGTLEVTYSPDGKLVSARWTGYKEKSFIDKNFTASSETTWEGGGGRSNTGGFGNDTDLKISDGAKISFSNKIIGRGEDEVRITSTISFEGSANMKISDVGPSITTLKSLSTFKPRIENFTYFYFSTSGEIKEQNSLSLSLTDQTSFQLGVFKFSAGTNLKSNTTEFKIGLVAGGNGFQFKREIKGKAAYSLLNKKIDN